MTAEEATAGPPPKEEPGPVGAATGAVSAAFNPQRASGGPQTSLHGYRTVAAHRPPQAGMRGGGGAATAAATMDAMAHHPQLPPCVVYSVGSRNELSFERAVKSDIGPHCEVHTFDMRANLTSSYASGAEGHAWGIAPTTFDDPARALRYKTYADTARELGHTGSMIDILKIDCDGCEWDLYPTLFEEGAPAARQILIELHQKDDGWVHPSTMKFFEEMHRRGYVIFHKEPNIQFWHVARCVEYSFLKLDDAFFATH